MATSYYDTLSEVFQIALYNHKWGGDSHLKCMVMDSCCARYKDHIMAMNYDEFVAEMLTVGHLTLEEFDTVYMYEAPPVVKLKRD